MKIPFTLGANPDVIAHQGDHVLLKSPTFVRDSQAWIEKHDPAELLGDEGHPVVWDR